MVYVHNDTRFEWDDEKNKTNIKKHGIGFKLAALVFDDEMRIEDYDTEHSLYEDRYLTIGRINNETFILTVVYTPRRNSVRIISARKATSAERSLYDSINDLG